MLILQIALGVALAPVIWWASQAALLRIVWFWWDVRYGIGPQRAWLVFAACVAVARALG